MLEKIINGISNKIYEVFGDNYKIYADNNVKQGLKNPCFFISVLNPSQKTYLKGRYLKYYPFVIQYFPKTDNDNFELLSVGEKLTSELEYITLENSDSLKGINLSYEIVDGILNFKINYNVFIQKINKLDEMENLTSETKLIKGVY